MQYYVHNGHAGPVLVQYRLASGANLEFWVDAKSISEGGFIVNEIFNDHEYLKHGVTLKPGDTVVDVGANIGVFGACALSSVLNGDIRYIAVEPCPKTFRVLQQNLLGDGGQGQQNSIFHLNWQLAAPLQGAAAGRYCPAYPGNMQLVQTALSSASATRNMTFYPHMPGNSTLRPEEKSRLQGAITPPELLRGEESLEVSVTSLTQLLESAAVSGPINLLKIDVEGEELEVLRGMDDACWARVQQVALEVHDCIDVALQSPAETAAASAHPATPTATAAAPAAATAAACTQGGQGTPTAASPAQAAMLPQGLQQHIQALRQSPPIDPVEGALAMHQLLLASLPDPRTCKDIDGSSIRYHPLPLHVNGKVVNAAAAPAEGINGESGLTMLPPPRDEGRVMVIARMLRDLGFTVVIECSLGLPMNYTVYGVRHGMCGM